MMAYSFTSVGTNKSQKTHKGISSAIGACRRRLLRSARVIRIVAVRTLAAFQIGVIGTSLKSILSLALINVTFQHIFRWAILHVEIIFRYFGQGLFKLFEDNSIVRLPICCPYNHVKLLPDQTNLIRNLGDLAIDVSKHDSGACSSRINLSVISIYSDPFGERPLCHIPDQSYSQRDHASDGFNSWRVHTLHQFFEIPFLAWAWTAARKPSC